MNTTIWKSVWAVAAGVLTIVILSIATDAVLYATGVMPKPDQPSVDSLLLLATAYRTLYSILGAYLTARLAPRKPLQHALALGVVGVVLGTLGAVITWGTPVAVGHEWYPIALAVLALPQCWLGGWLRVKQLHN